MKKRKRPSSQRSIPIDKLYRDGIIKWGNVYSKSWRFSDVNYDVASDDDKEQMFLMHSAILNGLPTDAFTKISIYNRTLGNEVIKQMVASNGDERFEQYKRELIDLLHSKMEESNSIVHDKYITVSTEKKNIEESTDEIRLRKNRNTLNGRVKKRCSTTREITRIKTT